MGNRGQHPFAGLAKKLGLTDDQKAQLDEAKRAMAAAGLPVRRVAERVR